MMARITALAWTRKSPALVMGNVFLRWRVLRNLPKFRQHLVEDENSSTPQTEEDEDMCLVCWGLLETEPDGQNTSPSSPAPVPVSNTELLPLQGIISNDTVVEGVASSSASTIANTPILGDVSEVTGSETLASSEKKQSLVQTIRSIAKHGSRTSRDIRNTSISSRSSFRPTMDVVQCTRGHKYHYDCLLEWIKEKGGRAPRLCEMCNNPYTGTKGRELTSLSIRQTLEANGIALGDAKTQSGRVLAALAMVTKFKQIKDQFFRAEYLSARNLTSVDVDREFLLMYRIPECLYKEKLEENPSLLSRSIHFRLFKRAVEVLEMHL